MGTLLPEFPSVEELKLPDDIESDKVSVDYEYDVHVYIRSSPNQSSRLNELFSKKHISIVPTFSAMIGGWLAVLYYYYIPDRGKGFRIISLDFAIHLSGSKLKIVWRGFFGFNRNLH